MSVVAEFRPDFERLRAANREIRSPDRLRAHYELEYQLASRLRSSRSDQRGSLYTELYSELFERLPDHPQHRVDLAHRQENTAKQVEFLRPFLSSASIYVEIGCGDAAVTQAIASRVREAVGVDVTAALVDERAVPPNFRFLHTNGTQINLPDDVADVVYSNQLMEHLHPEDAVAQLGEVCRVLKPGGVYICSTPSRLTGPHDISLYFSQKPVGLHMREYDYCSLTTLFRKAGFGSATAHVTVKGIRMRLPVAALRGFEMLLLGLPRAVRAKLVALGPVRNIAGVMLIGRK